MKITLTTGQQADLVQFIGGYHEELYCSEVAEDIRPDSVFNQASLEMITQDCAVFLLTFYAPIKLAVYNSNGDYSMRLAGRDFLLGRNGYAASVFNRSLSAYIDRDIVESLDIACWIAEKVIVGINEDTGMLEYVSYSQYVTK